MQIAVFSGDCPYPYADMLTNTIGIKESTAQVNDIIASPAHEQAGRFSNHRNYSRLEVFLISKGNEFITVFSPDNYRHALLRLGDSKLGTVKTFIFFRNLIKVYHQAVGQLTDGYSHTAGAEIVAALDEAACLRIAEQTLNLTLCRRITLLYLGSCLSKRSLGMTLRGAGSTTYTVTACTTADENDQIAGLRSLANNIHPGSGCYYGTDFQTLCYEARMVYLRHLTGSQTNLVAVRAVAGCGSLSNLLLGQLARKGILHGSAGIGCTGDSHRLIYISAAGQRVTNSTAQTGSCAAERLNLSGMVVGLVLEHDEPLFNLPVYFCRHYDAAGIDFIGSIEVIKQALTLQLLHAHYGNIHEGYIALLAAIYISAVFEIFLIGLGDSVRGKSFFHLYLVDGSGEGGMTAMVGPISVKHPDFGDCRLTLLLITEIFLTESQILIAHSQTTGGHKLSELFLGECCKAFQHLYISRFNSLHQQGLRLVQGSLTALNLVDKIALYLLKCLIINRTHKRIDTSRTDLWPLALGYELNALSCGVCPLIILTGEILDSKYTALIYCWQLFLIDYIYRSFSKHYILHSSVLLIGQALNIVTLENAYCLQIENTEGLNEIGTELLSRDIEETLTLFYKNSSD